MYVTFPSPFPLQKKKTHSNIPLTAQLDARILLVLIFIDTYHKFWDTIVILMCAQSIKDAVQLVVGILICHRFGPLIGQMTQVYTLLKMDDFRWGKTRIAVAHK